MNRQIAKAGLGVQMPPLPEHVRIYFLQKGESVNKAEDFLLFYEKRYWLTIRGRPIRNWKTLACNWIWNRRYNQ